HLSGTGISDLGDILFMPATGPVKTKKGTVKDLESGYASLYDHQDEHGAAGFYSVHLKRYDIDAMFTASKRVGFHSYNFGEAKSGHIIIDLEEGIGDRAMETYIRQVNDTTIEGYRFSRGWARDQRIYFTAIFSRPI